MSGNRTQSLTLVFAEGWAMDDRFWEPLAARFADHELRFCARQYYLDDAGNDCESSAESLLKAGEAGWVGIGHSYGFRRLLDCQLANCCGLVSICGFYDFVASAGTDARIVKAMVRRMESSPVSVLQKFLENCGMADQADQVGRLESEALNIESLKTDLTALLAGGPSGQDVEQSVPILSLAASHDKIVPAALTRSEFEQPLFHPTAGHSLGFQYSDWCASHIQEFLRTL